MERLSNKELNKLKNKLSAKMKYAIGETIDEISLEKIHSDDLSTIIISSLSDTIATFTSIIFENDTRVIDLICEAAKEQHEYLMNHKNKEKLSS